MYVSAGVFHSARRWAVGRRALGAACGSCSRSASRAGRRVDEVLVAATRQERRPRRPCTAPGRPGPWGTTERKVPLSGERRPLRRDWGTRRRGCAGHVNSHHAAAPSVTTLRRATRKTRATRSAAPMSCWAAHHARDPDHQPTRPHRRDRRRRLCKRDRSNGAGYVRLRRRAPSAIQPPSQRPRTPARRALTAACGGRRPRCTVR